MPQPKKEETKADEVKTIILPEVLTIRELADKMKMTAGEVKDIMKMAMDAMSMNAENADLEDLAEVEGIEITGAEDGEE